MAAASSASTAASQANIATTQAANSAASAATAEAARDATLAAFDNFDDRYLGAKAADPTFDNDGNALVAGSLYFNSAAGIMKVFTGSAWVAAYVSGAGFLSVSQNLADVQNIQTARENIEAASVLSPNFFGTPSAPTAAPKTSSTQIATTEFVDRLRSLLQPTTPSTGGTATTGDRGALLSVTGGVTIPTSVFAANDTFTIYNNSAANITLTQGAGLTLRQVGTASTGNRTLAQRGLATVLFISATEAVISGGGLT